MQKVYTVTTLTDLNIAKKGHVTRCLGWFNDLKKAKQSVLHNDLDMNEDGYYEYCVIEEIKEGLYSFPYIETWFRWIDGKYTEIEKPIEIKCICGFSMG